MKNAPHRQFAVRFVPPGDRARVPLDTYINALAAVRDGLASTRQSFAQQIADKKHWSLSEVRTALTLEVRPLEKGSLVTPVTVGAPDGEQVPLTFQRLPGEYWEYTIGAIAGACSNSASKRLTSSGADAFVRAADVAKDGKCTIHLAQREINGRAGRWTAAANLSKSSNRLMAYAQTQRQTSRAMTSLIGQVTDISFDPPSFRVRTSSGLVSVRAYARHRDQAQAAWGREAVVDVDACVDMEGNISDVVAVNIHIVPQDPFADFDDSFGSGAGVWTTPAAQKFMKTMRGGVGE